MKNKKLNNKLLEIEKTLIKLLELRDKLIKFTSSNEILIRADSIDAITSLMSFNIERLIKESLRKGDDLTKISIIELVSASKNKAYLKYILHLLEDEDTLVRAYVYESIGNLKAKKYLPLLLKKLKKKNTTNTEKLRILYSLLRFKKKVYFNDFISFLECDEYQVRSATANLLYFLVDNKNKQKVLTILKRALKNEKTIATQSTLKSVIRDLSEQK
ncbi:MAG: hypothetical protein ACNI25_16050 [Halarcobacter sp.]